ncbi:MAG TPA: penicillin-binding transpeptidase domain-containing protein [Steroidobacteraceae bacterium]|nr:penicillin-binding transpeptidase domain-containing protein [Steroidobacteraceae bacterium]
MKRRDAVAEFDAAQFRLRARLLVGLLTLLAIVLLGRALQLQVLDQQFLAEQGDMRYARVARMQAHRGAVLDRFGEPLAVSSPVDTVWVNPPELAQASDEIPRLARALKRDPQWLAQRITSNLDREFLYVARHMDPAEALRIKALGIPGVYLLREYRRYYPNGEVTGHLLGFTNLDEAGQEGLELAYDQSLAGQDGSKRVIQDGHGRIVQNVESISAPRPGEDLYTSLDLRIQYLAYRELKSAIRKYRARAGSVIVIDVETGEVLAMVNQPSFNPNDRAQYEVGRYRNRAATDIFEPGSSIKPFIVAAALSSGRFRTDSMIDTTPIKVGIKTIQDKHDLGVIDLGQVLARSSNVGMTKIALALEPEDLHSTLRALGFGEVTASGFPGESAGLLSSAAHWRPIGIATMSYGYGLSVTPLQLAQAYTTIGALGLQRPITFRRTPEATHGARVLPEKIARDLLGLLEHAVQARGTGAKAAVPGYRVAGKTGTAWKATAGGYSTDRYLAVFAGVVPATRPRLAAVVLIDEPGGALYYGGDVAAPVFSAVMSGALRLMSIAPDDLGQVARATLAEAGP